MSIRGGFGVYYNRDQEEQSLQNLEDPPNVFVSQGATSVGGSPSFANPFEDVTGNPKVSEPNPFPYTVPAAGSTIAWASSYYALQIATFDRKYSVPYTYNYNLNVQRALGGYMVLQIGYVGSVSHRLASWNEGDPITPAGHAACLAASATCALSSIHLFNPQYTADPALVPGNPYGLPNGTPWYLSDANQTTEGSSNYNSFQASLIKAPSHGYQFTLAYTYSHALDDFSGYESSTGAAGRVFNYTPGFKYLNYGSSDFDARQRIVASYIYDIPITTGMRTNLLLRETLGGWQLSGVTALQSGFPVSIYQSTKSSGWCDGYSYFGCGDVPETTSFNVQRLNPRSPGSPYFSTASFSAEPLGTFGNTPRNYFHGPGFDYTNCTIQKNFQLSSSSSRYLQLRLEGYNVFNHANFSNPVGNYNSSSFGHILSVDVSADPNGDPSPGRAVQLVGKFYF